MKSYIVHLIRHGITKGNINAQYIGHTDLPLTIASIEQLKQYKKQYVYPAVDVVFSSPLKRCVDTADILFPNNKPVIIPDFIEYNFGEFEGLTAKELENNKQFGEWLRGDINSKPPFGESNAEFAHRVCESFEKLIDGIVKTSTETSVIVAHAGVIMTILSAYGLPEAPMSQWMMDAGFGYTLRITPSLWMRTNKVEVIGFCPIENKE